ncbi:MAG: four helix bundle protein [Candidatus Sungbacteria bacterium]|nr:four helix bundle protein [Candidatus Sungbacteria bacterium]
MPYIQSFKELIVWQKGIQLVKVIYIATRKLPREETYGLTSQMRRAAVSIPSNIAEGKKRKTKKDFLQFLRVANGSAAELETQIIITIDLYREVDFTVASSLLTEVQKMLATIIAKLEASKS